MIIINFKNYLSGKKAVELSKLIRKYIPGAIAAVPVADIFEISEGTNLKVFAQHVDFAQKGRATGFVVPEDLKEAGAVGSLLNHSEHPLNFSVIKKTIERAEETKLKIILCAKNIATARKFAKLKPYAIAFEDPKLVASGKSITRYRTKEVEKFAALFRKSKIIPICGAGIHSADDVKAAKKLGCKGVLISSAIANVPLKKAEELLKEIGKI